MHFLEISQLTVNEITTLMQRAFYFKSNPQAFPNYNQYTVAHLFYEDSTRTRVSFEMAANHLNMSVINVDLQHSSENKGETLDDTMQTLAAMGVNIFVIRHSQDGVPEHVAELGHGACVINAGDGMHAHPSQAMLDMMTIIEQKPHPEHLKIAIVGDLRHSRVANSLQCMCAALNVGELALIAPELWQPSSVYYGHVTTSLSDGLMDADVVICLRVQNERLSTTEYMDMTYYRANYALTSERLLLAKPNAMVMHPGPLNRGVEIDSNIADGPQSFILEQVRNGVFMRMAILEYATSSTF